MAVSCTGLLFVINDLIRVDEYPNTRKSSLAPKMIDSVNSLMTVLPFMLTYKDKVP